MRAVLLFFLVCLINASTTDDTGDPVLDDMIDKLLDSMRELVKLGNMDETKIANIARDIEVGWGVLKVTAHCKCQDGWVRSLASLRRTAHVSKKKEEKKTVLDAKVSFEKLEFGFKQCEVKTVMGTMSPQVNGEVDTNSIDLQLSITGQGDQCVAAVDHIKVDKIGEIEIKTGGGFFHKIEDKILSWIADNFHDEIVKILDNELSNMVRKSVPKLDFCSKIPH